MNRRNFLFTLPALALGAELLVPKKTIFLPPRCGWFAQPNPSVWAVKTDGGYMFSNKLFEFLQNREYDDKEVYSVDNAPQAVTDYLYPEGLSKISANRIWSCDTEILGDPVYSPVLGFMKVGNSEWAPFRDYKSKV